MRRRGLAGAVLATLLMTLLTTRAMTAERIRSNSVYDSTCAFCHQTGGAGLKGQFPRLAGRVDRMAADPQARRYLIQIVLHGLAGRIEVDGAAIVGVMPGFAALSDADLASVLNYVVSLGAAARKVKPIAAAEVAAERAGAVLSASEVMQTRASLVAAGRMP